MPNLDVKQRGPNSFAATCRGCEYEFIAQTAKDVEDQVVQHELVCSDPDGEWKSYDVMASTNQCSDSSARPSARRHRTR